MLKMSVCVLYGVWRRADGSGSRDGSGYGKGEGEGERAQHQDRWLSKQDLFVIDYYCCSYYAFSLQEKRKKRETEPCLGPIPSRRNGALSLPNGLNEEDYYAGLG